MGKMKELEGYEAMYAAEDAHYEALLARGNLSPLERAEITVWRQGKSLRGSRSGLGLGAGSYTAKAEQELRERPDMVAAKKP